MKRDLGGEQCAMSHVFVCEKDQRETKLGPSRVVIVPLKLLLEFYLVAGSGPLTVFDQRNGVITCITRG